MPDLDALFWPRSIALVGASSDRTIIRGRIVEAVTLHGFDGPMYAVSRSHEEICGIPCYPGVEGPARAGGPRDRHHPPPSTSPRHCGRAGRSG